MMPTATEKAFSQGLLDVLIRAGLIAVLVIFCFQIFRPFLDLMLWSLILAVTLYPMQCRLKRILGRKEGHTAMLIVFAAIGILMVPVYLLGASLVESAESLVAIIKSDGVHVPPPSEAVVAWPLVGKPLYGVWLEASTNLSDLAQKHVPQIKSVGLTLLSKLAGFGAGFLIFISALIIAGIFLAFGEGGSRAAVQILSRICGPVRGPKLTELCTATIRAVALGVIGIAFIQMLLVGIGFVVMGIPAAGLLAMAVLLLGIMQLPATLITLPVIIYVIATHGVSVGTIVFAIYVLLAGLVDNVLKPLLLGRGVDVPMPVVLIGALGGMVTSGIVGLFIGPVVLAVSYQLFWQWVEDQPAGAMGELQGS